MARSPPRHHPQGPSPRHQPAGINDGKYGNDHSWIGTAPRAWFQIDLGKTAKVGCFKLGRDRTGVLADRAVDYLKIETSSDARTWQTVFEQSGLSRLEGNAPNKSMLIFIAPVEARFVKATADGSNADRGEFACVDEFEIFPPAKKRPDSLPLLQFQPVHVKVFPVRRTTLEVTATARRAEGDDEVLDLDVHNTGPMTALFCEPHPMLVYRTDLFVENNNCFVPPGEHRVISIRASIHPQCGLSLAQTGWTLCAWNADDVTINPNSQMLLSIGRQDVMCREFMGCENPALAAKSTEVVLEGNRPDSSRLPFLMRGQGSARFHFDLDPSQTGHAARLRIHTADQSSDTAATVQITINGRTTEATLPIGLGIQNSQPAHRAYPATLVFELAGADLHPGANQLTVRVKGDGWFTWDSMDLETQP